VDRVRALRAQVRMPGLLARARRLSAHLADLIGPGEPTEVRALPGARAGDEETHVSRWRLRAGRAAQPQERPRDEDRQTPCAVHVGILLSRCAADRRRAADRLLQVIVPKESGPLRVR